ncbi:MAG: [acyl-carrier-protein] S-malonyltransferase [Alphaproteobacteria bacterium RIFCSPLOWO2_01_FULL_45_8]|nr:MAG: [acyl-carrier-protein] S-malonyltransferase [Alphaproteobacteria bacterium GWB1_45_5]OFW75844.1 MAG: [acyl-carrier-protein] S-malonyltransferase [Alphaproteobacteria bacterium GWA1_45_9]OFW89932.1 MAG: [acyl-carrier-protein] S-malonyltransferase [Alphaproteobacteria bacterium RIFCSPHIGHO2_01_FULL_41_14]OFW96625.1 MAG: [acyl-carrier-protein] S-malonyltransferase [Alphaproteobacteria bacterium RIFCSPLOWO2_01_FULL_45_8]HCI48372.1 [acyl-carrier-protein] S-malonyltransferase [Holosporales ba
MKQALLFPGQGSQVVGMGRDLYDAFPVARQVFEELDDALSQNLTDLIFEGPADQLMLTENTQPALVAVSMAALRVLNEAGIGTPSFSYAAGHSLGEYAALCAGGVLNFTDTVKALKERGRAMQHAVPVGQGGMVALIGASLEQAETISQQVSRYGVCEVANDNCPGQIVLSGELVALSHVAAIAESLSIRKVIPLKVSAPFHSSLMMMAAERMKNVLEKLPFENASLPILPNVTVVPETDGDILRNLLVRQITGRVRWTETIQKLQSLGVTRFVEVGAGTVLSGLVKRISPDVRSLSIQSPRDVEEFMALEA